MFTYCGCNLIHIKMKKIFEIFIVISLLALLSWEKNEAVNNPEIIITKTSYKHHRKIIILVFDNGTYTREVIHPEGTSERSMGTLAQADFTSLKKLIRNCRPILLKSEYTCNKEVDHENYTQFYFNELSYRKNVTVDNGCGYPKKLKELEMHLMDIVEQK